MHKLVFALMSLAVAASIFSPHYRRWQSNKPPVIGSGYYQVG